MRIWAVDPGAVFSGVAFIKHHSDTFSWGQFSDPTELWYSIMEGGDFHSGFQPWTDTLLIEDYTHGGAFTKEAKQTLEVFGYIKLRAQEEAWRKVEVRHKDKRLSAQREAAKLMESTVAELKDDPARKDAFSALAHCIAYRREMGM